MGEEREGMDLQRSGLGLVGLVGLRFGEERAGPRRMSFWPPLRRDFSESEDEKNPELFQEG